jgi:hypothetical protein
MAALLVKNKNISFQSFQKKDKSSQPLVQKMFHQLHFAGSVSSENI